MNIGEIVRKILRREEKEKYILLWREPGTRERHPIAEYDYPVEKDEIEGMLTEPGEYLLMKKFKGRWAGKVWDKPIVIREEEVAERVEESIKNVKKRKVDSDAIAEAIEEDLVRGFRWLTLPQMISQAFKKAQEQVNIPQLFGSERSEGVVSDSKNFKKMLLETKKEFDELAELFGYAPKRETDIQEKRIPVKGEIPAWLVYMPDAVDTALEKIERRLERWGVVEKKESEIEKAMEGEEELIKLPEKPKIDISKIEELKVEEEKIEEKKEEGGEVEEKEEKREEESK